MELRDLFAFVFVGLVVQCSAMSISELEDFANFLKKTSQLDETLKKGTDAYDLDEDETVSDHAWEESGKFEGDLILNDRQRRMIVEDIAEGLSRNGLRDSTKKWPDNEVIYYIQKEHFSSDQVEAIQSGIDDLARASCVKFRPYQKGDRDAVVIQGSRRGCFSQVGYQGGYQVLNLSGRHPVGRGCFRHGTVVHELLHTLGFYHMQSSPDRDDFVDVVWENIVQPARHNFRKYNAFAVSDFGVGYDYDSVLHYSRRAFSSNGQDTIVPKQSGAQIGQRVGLSDKDSQKLNKMYCDADSNSDEEENTTKKVLIKKKTPKNKPFDGHGIGYHQGKTVVIKLLPEEKAETFQIISKPAYSLFDHFSKTPQVLPLPETKTEEIGKPVTDLKSINLPDIYNRVRSHVPAYKMLVNPKIYEFINLDEAKIEKEANKVNSTQELDDATQKTDILSNDDDEFNAAFHRLSKILKTHVYPSQSPSLRSHIFSTDYTDFVKPNKLTNIGYAIQPTYSEKLTENNKKAEEYIKSLYNNGPESLVSEKKKQNHDRLEVDPENVKNIEIEQNMSKDEKPRYSNPYTDKQHHTEGSQEIKTPVYATYGQIKDISKEDDDSSYRTAYPFKNHHHISNGSQKLKTPNYAIYEHLKDIHDYSDYDNPNAEQDKNENVKYHKLFGESVPVYSDWYTKQELKQNPVNYDKVIYSDYIDKQKMYDHEALSSEYEPENRNEYYANSYSPQQKEFFGAPVPLTKEWYKVSRQALDHYPYYLGNPEKQEQR